LRDNLAAAQSMAVYHRASSTPQFPIACVAAASHPGTSTTIADSTRFDRAPDLPATSSSGVPNVYTSFLNGKGTNGWEFNPPGPDGTEAGFIQAINNSGSNLNKALTNLAYMAGDRYGAYPPRQDSYASPATAAVPNLPVTHPLPELTMWGNFSNLRRIMNRLNGLQGEANISYNALSPADKTTLHTAACTIQMLAHNLRMENDIWKAAGEASVGSWTSYSNAGIQANDKGLLSFNTSQTNWQNNNSIIAKKPDGTVIICNFSGRNAGNNQILANDEYFRLGVDPECPTGANFFTNTASDDHFSKYFDRFGLEDWIAALKILQKYNVGPQNNLTALLTSMEKSVIGLSIVRDRTLGFKPDGTLTGQSSPTYDPATATYIIPPAGGGVYAPFNSGNTIKVNCDPAALAPGSTDDPFSPELNQSSSQVLWAMVYCGSKNPIRYPSLYYLFPRFNHGHAGTAGGNDAQPTTEPYVASSYIQNAAINGGYTYQAVDPASIALSPRLPANWQVPNTATPAANGVSRVNTIVDNYSLPGTPANRYPAFLDKGMFNGREMMGVRVLDIDLDLLRRNAFNSESWLPNSGIIYSFREDAVREDAIARPRGIPPSTNVTFASCDQVYAASGTAKLFTTNCLMDAVGPNPKDPPLYLSNAAHTQGISIKPVDFFADPDRRPHGFRLRNGADLRRIPNPPADFQMRGMSFVSDNPVYIMTDGNEFNGHRSGNTLIEEFTQLLPDAWGFAQFYGRTDLNSPPFAAVNDQWRPTEILTDAVTILSRTFTDGWIAQGIRDIGTSSYRLLNGPQNDGGDPTGIPLSYGNTANLPWLRENGRFSRDVNMASPIKISRRGFPLYCKRNMSTNNTNTTDAIDMPPPSEDNTKTCEELGGQPQEYGREVPDLGPRATANQNRRFITFATNKSVQGAAANQRVNAMLISGITPSRVNNAYGGMHNFPRFLETWGNLYISGTLMQLSFSNYATAPFDQDSWEPGNNPLTVEHIRYYGPPTRRWGYDVALQYAPATPVAVRMAELTRARDEFYRELSATDPYVCTLRRAINFPCN